MAPQSEDDIKSVVERARKRRENKKHSQDLGPGNGTARAHSHELRSASTGSSDRNMRVPSDYYN